jgi:hypothetical protein
VPKTGLELHHRLGRSKTAADPVRNQDNVRFGEDLEQDGRAFELRRAGRVLKRERIPTQLLILINRGEKTVSDSRPDRREDLAGSNVTFARSTEGFLALGIWPQTLRLSGKSAPLVN